jgi:hypothetical protein
MRSCVSVAHQQYFSEKAPVDKRKLLFTSFWGVVLCCVLFVFGERRLVVLERVKDWVSGTNGRGLTFEMRTGVCSVSSWVTWFSSLLDMLGLAMASMLARLMIVVRPWKIARLKTF